MTSAETRQRGQLLPKYTMNRSADRTCTQKAYHSYIREARPSQGEYVVSKICPVHKKDKRNRPVNYDEYQRDTTTIP